MDTTVVNVKKHGAVGNGVHDDRAEIQDVLDHARGKRVVFPPGVYRCEPKYPDQASLYVKSDTTLQGYGLAVLARTNSTEGSILESWRTGTTGSITAGNATLDVAKADGFQVGAVCQVGFAAGALATQRANLSKALDEVAPETAGVTVDVYEVSGFPYGRLNPDGSRVAIGTVLIESELISYCATTPPDSEPITQFLECTRARYGTAGARHEISTDVHLAKDLMTTVKAVSGTRITLDDAATFSVARTPVSVGEKDIVIRNLDFDRRKPPDSADNKSSCCIFLPLARNFSVDRCVIENGVHGGIEVQWSRDGSVSRSQFINNGQPTLVPPLGSHIWLFNNCHRVTVNNNTIRGGTYGVLIDDRSDTANSGNGPCLDNSVDANLIVHPPHGIGIEGSSRNVVVFNRIFDCAVAGIEVVEAQGRPDRGTDSEKAIGNMLHANTLCGCKTPIYNRGTDTVVSGNRVIGD